MPWFKGGLTRDWDFVVIMPRGVSLPASSAHIPFFSLRDDVCGDVSLARTGFLKYTDSFPVHCRSPSRVYPSGVDGAFLRTKRSLP